MNNCLITLKNINRIFDTKFQKVVALRSINLTVKKNDFLSILGPSGSGKSTLLHILGCLDQPTTGEYFLNDQAIHTLNDKKLAKIRSQKIGLVFQDYNLIPQLTVYENVALPFLYQKGNNKAVVEIKKVINLVGMSHRIHHKTQLLSGGEKQRVAIARALVVNPSIILADEPTGNLDQWNTLNIVKLLQFLNKKGVTIILITHDERIANCTKRIIRMRDGSIAQDYNNIYYEFSIVK
ncbi:Macrolide export ATP-binding/permease protein MacB [Candidatus Rubidus massiliensis]|nr:Macrolide export ATP-binding/permease protein MacB [Candidatus Rubidus massiliensis]